MGRKSVQNGRWPANLILDSEAAQMLDQQSGQEVSRFFYCPKASRAERDAGLEGMEEREQRPLGISQWRGQTNGSGQVMGPSSPARNSHPTVKALALMRWLVRLVTPPGGTVLDPFLGSGTTAVACVLEGVGCVGIEMEPEYLEIARRRVEHAEAQAADQTGQTMTLPLVTPCA